MSNVCALHHIVFCTRNREMPITNEFRRDLYMVVFKIIKDMKCHLVRMGGVPNHVHMLVDIHPDVALARLMQSVKSNASAFLKKDGRFNMYNGWAKEYFAVSVSPTDKDSVINYINNQQEHHGIQNFDDELRSLCMQCYMDYDEHDMR